MVADIQVDMRRLVLEMQMVDKKFAAALRREIRAAVEESGQDDLVKIRNAASWSRGAKHGTSIADATTMRPNFTVRSAGIRIVTNRAKAPHARPFEGVGGNGEFENGHHGKILTRPFFFKSVQKMSAQTEARMVLAMDVICREAGFR